MKLNKKELLSIEGGLSVSGTLINAISRGVNVILDMGRALGSSLRRLYEGKMCPL